MKERIMIMSEIKYEIKKNLGVLSESEDLDGIKRQA